jgi:Helicase HerA, central domain
MDFEKLGLFYLGRRYDLGSSTVREEPVLYDSRDLVTHAVAVGMTGSGKTGLCIGLIEEAALDGVPVIAIDPKGDLGNLLLTFPHLSPDDFRPWIDEDEARRAGRTPEEQAADEAARWKQGLADWGQDGARIERLREAADFAIYTPGSRAGQAVSIVSSLSAPPAEYRDDGELLAERSGNTATSLLALAAIDALPRSREHTLLASVFAAAWRAGQDLDLAALIQQVQTPPFQKVGVVDLESFYPERERFELAMRLNGLLAAPGFEQWLEGAPLDPATLLYTSEGRPRVAIFSIAHLGDAERMFFVSLLLNQIVAWMRRQTGTTSLRAIVYMDEIMGFFPPVANPPAKGPLLTLLKQGRAFGIGVVLATQNPVDLDYKGLSNTGTWFLGRLQTERDKERVLDGLEGAAAGSIERAEADRILSGLGKRVFLLHNVHEKAPVVFQTRWTMSYLRGPLSRNQISELTASAPRQEEAARPAATPAIRRDTPVQSGKRPIVPPGIEQLFVPAPAGAGDVLYQPAILGGARVRFTDAKLGVSEERQVVYSAPVSDGPVAVDWAAGERLDIGAEDLARDPEAGAEFAPIPDPALEPRNYGGWKKDFAKRLAESETLELLSSSELKLTSHPGESERDFRIRLQDAHREARDTAMDAVRKMFAPKERQFAQRRQRAEAARERESGQASHARLQTAVSMGATILGMVLGRKAASTSTLGRATTAARGLGRSMKEAEDIKRAAENVEAIQQQEAELQEEVKAELQRITERFSAPAGIERIALAPRRGQVTVQFVALGWIPAGSRKHQA